MAKYDCAAVACPRNLNHSAVDERTSGAFGGLYSQGWAAPHVCAGPPSVRKVAASWVPRPAPASTGTADPRDQVASS